MIMRVLVIGQSAERSAQLCAVLERSGYAVAASGQEVSDLAARVRDAAADIVVVERDRPEPELLDGIGGLMARGALPVVVFARDKDPELMRIALAAGVSAYVLDGQPEQRAADILGVALVRFEHCQALQQELALARTTLAERKLIERAKGVVMAQRGCSEAEAYRLLRKSAMDRNQKLAQVAEQVIAMAALLT